MSKYKYNNIIPNDKYVVQYLFNVFLILHLTIQGQVSATGIFVIVIHKFLLYVKNINFNKIYGGAHNLNWNF